ncbi:replicative DNA helicase [Acinetobacter calcoaceticus]|uniref:DNA 5'-3' helicase n=1 Tax=Acinetobacter calcoaceticus TaxID=471 RepID=A0A4R1XKU2_ACICA|nr:replicative DNA helicase [Acinetobacter calcoaceticus]
MADLFNIAIEQSVLVSLMTVQNSLEQVNSDLDAKCFHSERHQTIFKTITDLANESKPYDIVLVEQRLTQEKKLELSGGSEYLIRMLSDAPTSFYNLEPYVAELNRFKKHRELLQVGQSIIALANDLTVQDVFTDAESLFSNADESGEQVKTSFTFEEALKSATELVVAKADAAQKKEFVGVQFNLTHLDRLIGTIKKGHLCVIAGRPGSGKSTLAQMLTIQTAFRFNEAVLFISAEMDKDTLTNRCVSALGEIPYNNIHNAELYGEDFKNFAETTHKYKKLKIHIEDKQQPTISEVRSYARKAKRRYKKLGCIVIDYIGLIRDPSIRDRTQEVASISRKLKALAKEFECPVIVLAQLNRESEGTDKPPRIHNLKESGQIEQDADQIILVHPVPSKENDGPSGLTEMIVGKNRHGKKGKVVVMDRLDICRFMGVTETTGASA